MPKKSKNRNRSEASNVQLLVGKLEVTRGGRGYVIVAGNDKDIMIKQEHMSNALDGDEVQVEVRGYADNNKRKEGIIKTVIHRKQSEFSGTIELYPHFAFLVPDNEKMLVDIYIPLHLLKGAQNHDKAIVRIVEWTGKTKNPVGEVVSILTDETINEIAMQGILVECGFPLTFPDEVLEEAARYNDVITNEEVAKRKDLRGTFTCTIDPVDAKDFDDALSFKPLTGGYFEIGVHIADVSHYVQKDSVLDKEAYKRATSVYLPDRVLPMLPEHLSNQLCSLRPNEDKLTFSAIFVINKAGKVKEHWIGKTIIHSDKRYTYEQVQEVIEGAEDEHKDILLQFNEIAQNLRTQRFKKGAINFSSQEIRFKLDAQGKPIGIVIKESKPAHQLIEEFMLLANKTVAVYVSDVKVNEKSIPFPYRVHDVPDLDKLKVFSSFASKYGVKLDLSAPHKISSSFNNMLGAIHGKPEQHVLEQLGIRTMSKAVYTTDNIGHYGLGFSHYCHFTSPIRRYPDVLVHRILQDCLQQTAEPIKHLEVQCRHCSEQERNAMDAERTANKYKQVEFMQSFLGEEFEAVICGVATFGLWAETIAHKCEGMISISELNAFDEFEFVEGEYALVGRHTGMSFRMGDHVQIKVVATNLEKRRIDYLLASVPESAHRSDIKIPKEQPHSKSASTKRSNKKRS
jgi:ribonuclease R